MKSVQIDIYNKRIRVTTRVEWIWLYGGKKAEIRSCNDIISEILRT